MLTIERELAAAIYVLYAFECIHWLKQGQAAITLRWDGTWKRHHATAESYTLAGRMPIIVNPIDLRPAFIEVSPDQPLPFIDRTTGKLNLNQLPNMRLLTFFSALGAMNLLIMLPALLLTGFLGAWWQLVIALGIFVQTGIAAEVFEQARPWRSAEPAEFWREYIALLLNPIAAIRSGDVLLKGLVKIADGTPPRQAEKSSRANQRVLRVTVQKESTGKNNSSE